MLTLDMLTPFTGLRIKADEKAILQIDFISPTALENTSPASPLLKECQQQIQAYCREHSFAFDLPLSAAGTDFQQSVWQALQQISWGNVQSYGDIAARLGSSPRAVGNACRRNPLPLIVPCHRVVARSGIGGYAGDTDGGYLLIKQKLLRHEGLEF